jgi:hypothetical protein
MSNIITPQGLATITVPANESVAVFSQGSAQVSRVTNFPNYPAVTTLLGTVINGQTVFGPYASGAVIQVEATGGIQTLWEIGTSPSVQQQRLNSQVQVTPIVIADGGSMAFAAGDLLSGIVTATPTTGRSIQLPTGAAMDLVSEFAINDSIDWTLITLAAFALTITQGTTGHTIVGAAATAGTSGAAARFRTRKTAADTFVSYRLS